MTEDKQQDDKLFQEAIALVIHWQAGQHDPAVIAAVAHWAGQSPQHAKVWAEVVDIHQLAGAVLAAPVQSSPAVAPVTRLSSRRFSRRQLLWGSAAALAAVGVSVAIGPQLLLKASADFTTDTAQTLRIPFGEGTTIVLGPDSALNCQVTAQQRQVELLAGIAYFDVATDSALPLNILASGLNLRTTQGRFDLSHDAGFIRTLVGEGALAVTQTGIMADDAPERLTAGDWLSLDSRSGEVTRGQSDAQQVAAWRGGMVVADNEPLGAVISRIGRWLPGKVIITNAQLAAERINGLYHLANPLDALKAAVRPYGGNVHQISPWLTVVSAA